MENQAITWGGLIACISFILALFKGVKESEARLVKLEAKLEKVEDEYKDLKKDIESINHELKDMSKILNDLSKSIARLEGYLRTKDTDPPYSSSHGRKAS